MMMSVVVFTDLSGKKPHTQLCTHVVIASGILGNVIVSTLALQWEVIVVFDPCYRHTISYFDHVHTVILDDQLEHSLLNNAIKRLCAVNSDSFINIPLSSTQPVERLPPILGDRGSMTLKLILVIS